MTRWIQPTEALAEQLDIPPVPLPVADSTAAALEAGRIDLSSLARDVDSYVTDTDPADRKTPVLRRCAAALALAAANASLDEDRHDDAADLLQLAARHAPDDTGIRSSYGSALWLSGRRFDGLAQLSRAVRLNTERGRVVPMLWILTARALADAGRHGDALLLLEELAATGPTDFRFWDLIDSIDARSVGVTGGCLPGHADAVHTRLVNATLAATAAESDAVAAIAALGVVDVDPTDPPPLCLEVTASKVPDLPGTARPGTLAMLDTTVGVVRSTDAPPAPTNARSSVRIEIASEAGSASALVAVGPDGSHDPDRAEMVLDAVARSLAVFPADPDPQPEQQGFDHDLDPGSSLALASLIDVIRSATRLGVPTTGLPVAAVVEYGAGHDDGSLREMIRSLLDAGPSTDAIDAGLGELERRGFVQLDGDTVSPVAYIEFLARQFGISMGWCRFTHHDTHARSSTRRCYIACGQGVLRLGPTGEGGVSWSIRGRTEIQTELGTELAIISSPTAAAI